MNKPTIGEVYDYVRKHGFRFIWFRGDRAIPCRAVEMHGYRIWVPECARIRDGEEVQ